jgi:hypothetical protein
MGNSARVQVGDVSLHSDIAAKIPARQWFLFLGAAIDAAPGCMPKTLKTRRHFAWGLDEAKVSAMNGMLIRSSCWLLSRFEQALLHARVAIVGTT